MKAEEAEQGLIGLLLYSTAPLSHILTKTGLRPEHFANQLLRQTFEAIIQIVDDGGTADVTLIASAIGGHEDQLNGLIADAPPAANALIYATEVRDNHRWRKVNQAGNLLVKAAEQKDTLLEKEADELLTAPQEGNSTTYTTEALAELVLERFENPEPSGFPFPWYGLTKATGGFRKGEVMVLSGHTSHGKSVVMNQILAHNAAQGAKVGLYINEMRPEDFVERWLSGETQIPFARIRQKNLSREEMDKIMIALENVPFPITNIAGWTAPEVARHIRFHEYDIVGVDILNLISHDDEKDMRQISQVFNQVAKTANVALLMTAHVNEKRVFTAQRPRPTLGDIRQSGSIKNDADLVMFVYRDQDENGIPTDNGKGELYIAKGRNTGLEKIDVWLHPNTMKYQETPW